MAGALLLVLASQAGAHPALDLRIAQLSAAIAAAPRDAGLHVERARAHADHADWAAALADLATARELDAETPGLEALTAEVELSRGQPARAEAAAARALAADPGDLAAAMLRARALESLGRAEAAADALEGSLEAMPPTARPQPDVYRELARLLALSPSRREEALVALDAGLARLGPIVSLALPAIELEAELGRFGAALARLDAVVMAPEEKAPLRADLLARSRADLLARRAAERR